MSKKINRRKFIAGGLVGGTALGLGGWRYLRQPESAVFQLGPNPSQKFSASKSPRVIILSIDSLDPRYLYLNSRGEHGGKGGDWLMPNVRRFLEEGVWFENARCHMPAVTDPNHLNVLSGGSSAQSGLYSVSTQLFDWREDGRPNLVTPSLSWARDDKGRQLDTLFAAWKRKWPGAKTFYVSGKEWVARIFNSPGSGVDSIIGGSTFPSYIDPPPKGYRFYDPPGDPDAATDFETNQQKHFSRVAYEKNSGHFPPDMWIVNTTLKMLNQELPDFGVVVLAQADDLQHGLGAAWDPDEFSGPAGREISRLNAYAAREGVLDGMRDVDRQFGRLMDGLKGMPNYKDATIVLYSDHGHVTHRAKETVWEILKKSAFDSYDRSVSTNLVEILAKAGVIQGKELDFKGFCPVMGSSVGGIAFAGELARRRAKAALAKEALMAHRVINPETGQEELPWDVLDWRGMINGQPGLCEPGELYHQYFGPNDSPGKLYWPDVIVLARENWQLPAVMGLLTNVGLALPEFIANRMAPWRAMIGGHGSAETQGVVMAMQGPDLAQGKTISDPAYEDNHRLADIAVTLSAMLGLELQSTTIGRDRTNEITTA
ncbi:MAG: alkaline phosphatase family protein [Desulfatibacillum sp.]|nr:alkaline phosphatase family protein [Desulfatibacillum sp.]